MSLTRRHLFRTLSAVALAPLAKWLPKDEALIGDVRRVSAANFVRMRAKYLNLPELERIISITHDFNIAAGQLPVPQEEA